MAEGNGAQNQGKQPQSDQPNEAGGESADQKKLERAEKERERRRRRRRRKAELRRLERETLQQPVQPKEVTPEPPKVSPKPEPLPAEQLEPVKEPAKPLEKKAAPKRAPRKKTNLPKEPSEDERHVIPRSEEHAPRSKDIVPQGEPEKPFDEKKPIAEQVQQPAPEEHPLTHKTHSFTGPLIEPSDKQPEPEPKAEPAVEPEPQPEPEPPQPSIPEPQPEPVQEPPQGQPSVPEYEPTTVPPAEDIVIHNEHEEKRPKVSMGHVHENELISEVPSIFPEEEDEHDRKKHEEPEEIKPIKEHPKKPQEEMNKHEQKETSQEHLSESEGLNVRKSFLQSAGGFSAGVLKSTGTALRNFFSKFKLRYVVIFLVLVVLGGAVYAGYLYKIHEKVYNYVADFFKAPPPVEVHIDQQLLNQWGITTALIFGDNWGSTKDLLASQLYNAYYFGRLKEPSVQGETGITASYYYGMGADLTAETNQFIGYISNLRELVSSYDVDVYAMLDQTTLREQSLDAYLTKLKDIQDKSTQIVKEINAEIDDLKISYDSLNTDRTRFESDFFVALKGLAGDKSDFLLKSFIDVTQKQAAIKAREAALAQLLAYYTSSMQKLSIRITAVEKNRQALVQGIHVVDIPGANLDIIIKESQ